MSTPAPNVVSLLTPAGRGAVATVRVEGPRAVDLVSREFLPVGPRTLAEHETGRIVFGHWHAPEGEEVVACRLEAEKLELHCHGGAAAASILVESLVRAGCRQIDWRQWTQARHGEPVAGEAQIALAEARTERTAAILLDQYHGALARALAEVENLRKAGDRSAAAVILREVLARVPLGLHLVHPWRIVLAGRPNVGKSSLINALVGYRRAIVHDQPGTTRDVLTATTALDGWPVEFSDTAGLRAGGDALESAAMDLARCRLHAADLVALVFDLSRPWSDEDRALAQAWPKAVVVHNKCDLPPAANGDRPAGLSVSALAGTGIDALTGELARRLVPKPPPDGAAVPFTLSQVAGLERTLADVLQGSPGSA
ncbi:MAG: GTPase [Pirellulales bacterium]